MTEMQFREAVAADILGILAAHVASIRVLNAPFYSPAQIEVWAGRKDPEQYRQAMLGGTQYFVAARGSEIVGFSCVYKDELTGLYLSPVWVKQGIGTVLCERAEVHALQQGHDSIHCWSSLQAQGFYLRRGYEKLAEERYILTKEIGLEAVKMRKVLS